MTVVNDAFGRTNETPIAAPWAIAGETATFKLESTAAAPNDDGADCAAIYNGSGSPTWGNDQSSAGKFTTLGTSGSGSGPGLYVRHAASAKTGYRFIFDHAASNNCEIAKFVAGAFTQLRVFTQAWTDGDTWELRVIGTTLSFWLNGTQVSTNLTDSGVSSGSPGIATSGPVHATTSIDDWVGSDEVGVTQQQLTGTAAGSGAVQGSLSAGVTYIGTGTAVTATSGDVTANYPTGASAPLTGDIIVCVASSRDNVSLTFPAGWTKKAEANNGTGLRQTIAYHRRAGGESETSVAVTHTAGAQIIARVHVVRGAVSSGDPFEASAGPTSVTSGSTGAFPDVTTLATGDLLFYALAYQEDFTVAPSITNAQGLTLADRGATEVA